MTKQNLSMKRGDTKVMQAVITNLSATGLTGFSYWFTAKGDIADLDAAAVISKVGSQATPGDFETVTIGDADTDGVITCIIEHDDTANLPDYDVQLQYDVQVEAPDGKVTTVADGILTVKPDVTRSVAP